jgi:hypothetical protein
LRHGLTSPLLCQASSRAANAVGRSEPSAEPAKGCPQLRSLRFTAAKPTHDVRFVRDNGKDRDGNERKGSLSTNGAAWADKDGKGLPLKLDCLPIELTAGDLVVRVRSWKTQREGK